MTERSRHIPSRLLGLGVVVLAVLSAVASTKTSRTASHSSSPTRVDMGQVSFPKLRDVPVRVQVSDEREERTNSDAVRANVADLWREALQKDGVAVRDDSENVLHIRVRQYGSTFAGTDWTGCARFTLHASGASLSEEELSAHKCVTKHNAFGYRTADEALAQAYRDAITELIYRYGD